MPGLPKAGAQNVPLLSTKLTVPPPRAGLVPRPRLIERLDEGLLAGCPLTLISAPAGFGKTTLVSAWLSDVDRPCAWLSLDESDNDAVRFLSYFVAALQKIDSQIGRSVQSLQHSPQPTRSETLWIALVNDIAATPRPLLMVIDDYHLIHSMQIHQQLASFLDHLPQQMHLVISTREDPPLPLSRLRARGHISEVRQADLRFSLPEAAMFLNTTMGLGLTPEDIAVLEARTEGWIAGLQLAALSMRQTDHLQDFVQSFAGSNRYVLDYLTDEVIERQPPEVREFLLQTSILERLSAPLCNAVTARDTSDGILLALEQSNLFLVPLDESRQWYRYHSLFAELLRHRLRSELGAEVTRMLHGRAQEWCAAHNSPEEAIRHALAAEDWERAAALIHAESSSMLNRGELATLLRWMGSLPEDVIRADPQLCCTYAWPLVLSGQIETAKSYLKTAEEVAPHNPALQAQIAPTKIHISRAQGDMHGVVEWSGRALSLLPPDDLSGRAVVAVGLGMGHWYLGHLDEAEQAFQEADRTGRQSGNLHVATYAQTFLGRIAACRGQLRRAVLHYEQGTALGAEQPPAAMGYMDWGTVRYEWDDLPRAAQDTERAIALSQHGGAPDITAAAQAQLAVIRLAQRDDAAALAMLEEAQRTAREVGSGAVIHARLAACQVQAALALGDLDTAARWAQRLGDRPDFFPFYPLLRLTAVRLLLAQGRKAEAAERAQAAHTLASRAGWHYGAIEARVWQALAAPALDQALPYLKDALSQAEPEGYVRTFVDKGPAMAALLREAAVRGMAPQYVGTLLAAFGALAGASPEHVRPGIAEQPLPEPLSERELETLHLLAQGLSNQEIAAVMVISLNTVKTHLKNVFAKLGVHRRQEAVTRARELKLLP